MPQFNKRGNRIRASDKSLVFRFSAGLLLPLFFVVVLLLNLKTILTTDWKSVSFLKDGSVHLTVTSYMIVTVIVSALFCAIAALLYQRFQYDRVKQLFHRQKLAKMILENGWYESETTQDSGFFKDLPATNKKEKITYFPKLYYRMDNGLLYIRTEITLGKYQDQLLHLEKKLETGLYCELVSKELHDSYVEYVLLYDTIANRILFNLISNVIRYGNDGKYLGIFLREDKANIYIDVTDKGKGIKKEFASNVFDRLYTMEDSRNREIQGNGLGLTIAKNLAVQLGGDIFLESIPNIKTTFTVKLKKISY